MGNAAGYAASKGGVIQLTRWLATTLAPDIRVNCLSPGGVSRDHPDAFQAAYRDRTPLGRMATEEDYKGATVFLASDLSRVRDRPQPGRRRRLDRMVTSTPPELVIGSRRIGAAHAPWVIPEIGINHEGDMAKARRMIDDAAAAGAEVVKFQSHSPADEMMPNDVVPANAEVSIWDIISRCTLTWDQERELKAHAEAAGLTYLSTPFSREAADHLQSMDVAAFKIGSGECNNLPLIDHIAGFGRPIILSTGMNDVSSISAVRSRCCATTDVPYALLHCTSLYPTPSGQGAPRGPRRAARRVPGRRPRAVRPHADQPRRARRSRARRVDPRASLHQRPDLARARHRDLDDPRRAGRSRPGQPLGPRGARRHEVRSSTEEQPTIDFAYRVGGDRPATSTPARCSTGTTSG